MRHRVCLCIRRVCVCARSFVFSYIHRRRVSYSIVMSEDVVHRAIEMEWENENEKERERRERDRTRKRGRESDREEEGEEDGRKR